jgi:hypothetical protein
VKKRIEVVIRKSGKMVSKDMEEIQYLFKPVFAKHSYTATFVDVMHFSELMSMKNAHNTIHI